MNIFTNKSDKSIAIIPLTPKTKDEFLARQKPHLVQWAKAMDFKAKSGEFILVPSEDGNIDVVLVGVESKSLWDLAILPKKLPEGIYHLQDNLALLDVEKAALGWGLASYKYDVYKKESQKKTRQLLIPQDLIDKLDKQLAAIFLVRDLINTPSEDLGPDDLSDAVQKIAKEFSASFSEIVGKDLLKENFPAVYLVGRGSHKDPRLLELRWGDEKNPHVTVVGKGVCFDSGGLDLKPPAGMLGMHKDMGGAAHALGLARLIMDFDLPIYLRLLIPAVENLVGDAAYRPGDVVKSRKGDTIEIGNTDAEGRVILSDALAVACEDKPEIVIDFATLTGAARVGLGPDLPGMFCPDKDLMHAVIKCGEMLEDEVWPMPLYQPYKKFLESKIADICNNSSCKYGGAITAALFLQNFVKDNISWMHFDIMAANTRDLPGRPIGGEAQSLRAVFEFCKQRFAGE